MNRRFRAAGLHLLISAFVAAAVAVLVFQLWYPSPYGAMAGGLTLFAILVGVDMALGPLLTAVIASANKPRAELVRDIAVIALVQVAAFGYGVYTLALARPVYVVFEVDRLRVLAAADLEPADLAKGPAALRSLPWTGPKFIATVPPTDSAGLFDSVGRSLNGADLAMQPDHWADYESANAAIVKAARPVSALLQKYPQLETTVRDSAGSVGVPAEALRFLPLTSQRASWVALMAAPEMRVVGFAQVDGFF